MRWSRASSVGDFVAEVKSNFLKMCGSDVGGSPDYTWIVNDRHCARVSGLLSDAREKGATVIPCADYDVGRNSSADAASHRHQLHF